MICKLPQHTWITFLSPWAIFGNRSEIIFRGVGQQHFPVCSQKERGLTLPYMKYFEILTHHYVWSNKELEEFPASFASSKTSYFIPLFGILTSDARIFRQEILCCLIEVSCPILNLIVLRPSDLALKRKYLSLHLEEEIYWVYQALVKNMIGIQHKIPLCIMVLLYKENKFKATENLMWDQLLLGSVFEQSLDSWVWSDLNY